MMHDLSEAAVQGTGDLNLLRMMATPAVFLHLPLTHSRVANAWSASQLVAWAASWRITGRGQIVSPCWHGACEPSKHGSSDLHGSAAAAVAAADAAAVPAAASRTALAC